MYLNKKKEKHACKIPIATQNRLEINIDNNKIDKHSIIWFHYVVLNLLVKLL